MSYQIKNHGKGIKKKTIQLKNSDILDDSDEICVEPGTELSKQLKKSIIQDRNGYNPVSYAASWALAIPAISNETLIWWEWLCLKYYLTFLWLYWNILGAFFIALLFVFWVIATAWIPILAWWWAYTLLYLFAAITPIVYKLVVDFLHTISLPYVKL